METITFKIKGEALLMHSVRLANPMAPLTKRMKALTSIRKKTDENLAEIADIEFEGGLYHDEKLGPYIPGLWIDACMVDGGKLNKNGTKIKQSAICLDDMVPLEYEGPRSLEKLRSDPKFRDVRAVTVGQAKTMRCRPKFTGWAAQFTVQFDPTLINRNELIAAVHAAGQTKGIGDFRPRFGRFTAEVVGRRSWPARAWRCAAWQGRARQGSAASCRTVEGPAGSWTVRQHRWAWRGVAWRGRVWQGEARQGRVNTNTRRQRD
jgi:hypothetical protein